MKHGTSRHAVPWFIRVLAAAAILPLLLSSSSASTLGPLTSAAIWSGTSPQPHYAQATIRWGLGWDTAKERWTMHTAGIRFFNARDAGEPVSMTPNHTVSAAIALSTGDSCMATRQTTPSTGTDIDLDLTTGSCADKTISPDTVTSVSLAVDGSAVVGAPSSSTSATSEQASFTPRSPAPTPATI